MNKETKETTVRLVPREHILFFKDDESFVRRIAHDISTDLAERILSILNSEGEIIVRQSDLLVEEQKMLNQVEYRQNIMWTPLVRCKDCRWHEQEQPGMVYCPAVVGGWVEEDWFCAGGVRKDGDDDE